MSKGKRYGDCEPKCPPKKDPIVYVKGDTGETGEKGDKGDPAEIVAEVCGSGYILHLPTTQGVIKLKVCPTGEAAGVFTP